MDTRGATTPTAADHPTTMEDPMTNRSPADTLTAAAKLLRERATAVPSEHWGARPWHVEDCGKCPCIVAQGEHKPWQQAQDPPIQYVADAETPEHGSWIALMHPGVGLALARWLEQAAKAHEASITAAGRVWPGDDAAQAQWVEDQTDQHALAVARQLLGEGS